MMINFEEIFNESYLRLLHLGEIGSDKSGEIFFSKFYKNFTDSSPDVSEKFQNTDMQKQKVLIQESFDHMLKFHLSHQATDYLHRIAHLHNEDNIDISPQLYDLWLASLIATVKELDPKYDRDVGLAWEIVMSAGITYMKDSYCRND